MSDVDLELKNFEDKINKITEQFMTLLDSSDVIESAVNSQNASNEKISDATHYSNVMDESPYKGLSTYKLENNMENIGGIHFDNPYESSQGDSTIPKCAVRFDSVEQYKLNCQLESLYAEKRNDNSQKRLQSYPDVSSTTFSGSNLMGGHNPISLNNYSNQSKTNSTNDKEGSKMLGFSKGKGDESTATNGYQMGKIEHASKPELDATKGENSFYAYATIPTEKSLVEKKNWKEVLCMDIPWDTKIDIWGSFKQLVSTKVKFTF